MAQAAYEKRVKVSTDGSTWHDVPATTSSVDLGGDVLDDTTLINSGYRGRVLGLHDWSISMDCNYTAGNTALATIRNAKINRSALHVQYLPDNTLPNGIQGQVVVESFNLSGEVSALETVSITLQGNGAIAVAS